MTDHLTIDYMMEFLELKYPGMTEFKSIKAAIMKEFDVAVSLEELHYWEASRIESEDAYLRYHQFL